VSRINSELFNKLKKAVESINPVDQLILIVKDLKKKGYNREQVTDIYQNFLSYIMDNGTEEQDDAVRDTLDYIVGWCSESQDLFRDEKKEL